MSSPGRGVEPTLGHAEWIDENGEVRIRCRISAGCGYLEVWTREDENGHNGSIDEPDADPGFWGVIDSLFAEPIMARRIQLLSMAVESWCCSFCGCELSQKELVALCLDEKLSSPGDEGSAP